MTHKEAIETLTCIYHRMDTDDYDKQALNLAIQALTITDSDGPHWYKNRNTFWTCSECNFENKWNRQLYKFCPNCGAYLGGFDYENTNKNTV